MPQLCGVFIQFCFFDISFKKMILLILNLTTLKDLKLEKIGHPRTPDSVSPIASSLLISGVTKAFGRQGALCTRTAEALLDICLTGSSHSPKYSVCLRINFHLTCFFCICYDETHLKTKMLFFLLLKKKRHKLTCTGCCLNYFIA